METPEFCHKFSLWAWYSLDDVTHLQNGSMCPMQQDDGSALTAEMVFCKYPQTTTWWKLQVCISAYDTKRDTLSLSGLGFFQFFLMMLYKFNQISCIWVGTGTENMINSWYIAYALAIHKAGEANKEKLNFI